MSWWTARSDSAEQGLLNNLVTENVGGKLLRKVGRQLMKIITGDHHLLKLVIENGLSQNHYMELAPLSWHQWSQRPRGPGFVARAGRGSSKSLLSHYDFTDVSSHFLLKMGRALAGTTDVVEFQELRSLLVDNLDIFCITGGGAAEATQPLLAKSRKVVVNKKNRNISYAVTLSYERSVRVSDGYSGLHGNLLGNDSDID
ncbi:hypothetical protein DER45DRAFT_600000 [Fusarium avenaceum]|nr:hypothetical protein DER45DRAFT_600000 [Fusarium avenaceum]